jgi:hypothetical protein
MEQTTKLGRKGNGRHENSVYALKRRRRAIIVSKEKYGEGEEWESGRAWAKAQGNVNMASSVCRACQINGNWYGLFFRYRDEPIPKLLVQEYESVYVNAGCRELVG